jgi:hypothetical protein
LSGGWPSWSSGRGRRRSHVRRLLIGANLPYDLDPERLDGTLALLRQLGAEQLLIASHEPELAYERLLEAFPGALWHIRFKGSRGWWPKDIQDAEWLDEFTPVEACTRLLKRGVTPHAVLWNEPDIELPPDELIGGRWACDDPAQRAAAWSRYSSTAAAAIAALRREFGDQVKLGLAPLSQGNPERFDWWRQRYQESGLLTEVDFIYEHCYFPGPVEDPDWGGRFLEWTGFGLPIHILEANDNGQFATQDPGERAQAYADYAAFVATQPDVACVSLFTLPGGKQDGSKPTWWFLTPEIAAAVGSLSRERPQAAPAAPPEPVVAQPDPIAIPAPSGGFMFPDDVLSDLWKAIRDDVPLNPQTGLFKKWAEDPVGLGSPVGPERPADGSVFQAFARGVLRLRRPVWALIGQLDATSGRDPAAGRSGYSRNNLCAFWPIILHRRGDLIRRRFSAGERPNDLAARGGGARRVRAERLFGADRGRRDHPRRGAALLADRGIPQRRRLLPELLVRLLRRPELPRPRAGPNDARLQLRAGRAGAGD